MQPAIPLPASPKNYTYELAKLLEKSNGMKRYFEREEISAAYLNSSWCSKAHLIWAMAMFGTPVVFKQYAEDCKIDGGYNEFRKRLLRGFHKNHTDNWMDIVKIDSNQAVIGRKIRRWAIIVSIAGFVIELFIEIGWDLIFPNGNSF